MRLFTSFRHSDEENAFGISILGGKILSITECEKYKGIPGAKRPKFKKFSRAKRAKMKKKQVLPDTF